MCCSSTCLSKCFDLYPSPSIRFLVYQIVDGERIPFGDYEIGEWDLSLCTGYPEPYPDPSVRAGYMHSFAVTENYIILPTTSYLLDYCQFFGKFKEFSFRKLASFSSPSIMADLHEKFRPYPAFQLFFNLVFGKNWPRQWLRIVSFFMNINTLPVKGHVYSVRYINRLNVNGVPLGHELI